MTSVGKLYRPNEAIKSGRRRVITAYKDARKILPIPAIQREGSAEQDEKNGRWKEGGRVRCERVRVFFPLLSRQRGLTPRLFLFLPGPKFDRLNPNTGGVEFPARENERTRELPSPFLPGSGEMPFVARNYFANRSRPSSSCRWTKVCETFEKGTRSFSFRIRESTRMFEILRI